MVVLYLELLLMKNCDAQTEAASTTEKASEDAASGKADTKTADSTALAGKKISVMTPYLTSVTTNQMAGFIKNNLEAEGAEVFVICAQIEQELADLDDDEKKEYLEDLGVSSSGLDKLVAASYSLLGLISFLTAGEDECRAWTIKKGTKAPQAAGNAAERRRAEQDPRRGLFRGLLRPERGIERRGQIGRASCRERV